MNSNMLNKDTLLQQKAEILANMKLAAKDGKDEDFVNGFNKLADNIQQRVLADVKDAIQCNDNMILASRGVHTLTSAEQKFYNNLIEASKAPDVKQALSGMDIIMPETIVDNVFENIKTEHPLLSKIDFINTTGLTKIFTSENGVQKAKFGKLNSKIVQELFATFVERDMTLVKLSSFIPVSKDMLELGPQYIDKYVREILYESIVMALEDSIVCGDGKDQFIGMDRYVGDDVSVQAGVYPEKEKIKVKKFDTLTVGKIVARIVVDKSGKPRAVRNLGLIVNPQDYYEKVMPATTVMSPDGTYRNDVMPVPMDIIQSTGLPRGKAIMGMLSLMFAGVGMAKNGKIEYSDEYQFLEDNRVYLDKMYANGFPKDNNAFQVLDISELEPIHLIVEVNDKTPSSNDAKLLNLSLGSAILAPEFDIDTKVYTSTTKTATNTITATPSDAASNIKVLVNEEEISNGEAAKWKDGQNTVKVYVTNGTGSEEYTVTVTKEVA